MFAVPALGQVHPPFHPPEGQQIPDSLKRKPVKVKREIPFKYFAEPGYHLADNDSLKRWQLWTTMSDWKNMQPGQITYRLGEMGRTDASTVQGHTFDHQKYYYDDLLMNNPVTGGFNINRLPEHYIASYQVNDWGLDAENKFRSEDFYVLKPMTRVFYEQASSNLRNLDAMVTQNIGRKWNILTAYWVKSTEGAYKSGKVSGSQINAAVTYHMSHHFMWKTSFLYNGLRMQEPDGYNIANMNTFNFDRLNTNANLISQSNGIAHSSMHSSMIRSTIYFRSDTTRPASFELTGYANNYKRLFDGFESIVTRSGTGMAFPADTSFYKVGKLGVMARKSLHLGPTILDVSADINRNKVNPASDRALTKTFWTMYDLRARNEWNFFGTIHLNFSASQIYRSDHYSQRDIGARLQIPIFPKAYGYVSLSAGSRIPTIQSLYWKTLTFSGNRTLKNEQIQRGMAGIHVQLSKTMQFGGSLYDSRIADPVVLSVDSTFQNIGTYHSLGGEAWFKIRSKSWEFNLSSTYQDFKSTDNRLDNQLLNNAGTRLWNRASLYWTGYALSAATYVKIGLFGIYSPFSYRSPHYYPTLDTWQYNNEDQKIPPFYRLDFDLSARIRWFMVYFRYENVLDGLNQLGYFETANYPMPARRLLFGMEVIFRN